MHLEDDDFAQFLRLQSGLVSFVKRETGRFPDFEDFPDLLFASEVPLEAKMPLVRILYEDPTGFIDAYLTENPDGLAGEDRDIVESWKSLRFGKFVLFRQLKKHTVVLGEMGEEVFGVLGLTEPIKEVVGTSLPRLVQTALLPFKGMIVHDGFMESYALRFSKEDRESLNASYKTAKAGPGLTTRLSSLGAPARPPTAADRVRRLAARLRNKLETIREEKKRIREFEEETEPAFRKWLSKKHGDLQDQYEKLKSETERLEEVLDRAHESWMFREHRTKARTVDVVIRQMEDEEDEMRAFSETAGAGDEKDAEGEEANGEGGGGSGEDPFPFPDPFDGGIPDFLLDGLLAEYLETMRGIDVSTLSPEEYEKARRDFQSTFEHAANGDRKEFDKAMLRVGADESEENRSAVKKAFRKLARQVHPDRNDDFNEEAKEIWEELQLRKEALDLGALRSLETEWRLIRGDAFTARDEARLKRLKDKFEGEHFDIEETLQDYRTHPMWGRKGKTPPAEIQRQVKRDMEDDIALLKEIKAGLEYEIAKFRGDSTGKKKAAKRKRAKKKTAQRKTAKKKTKGKKATSPKKTKVPRQQKSDPPPTEQTTFDFG